MKFGAIGCSHTSQGYGEPWPIHLGKTLEMEPIIASSSGAGNSMFIEKCRRIADTKPDLIVVQITEPTRITTGLASFDLSSHTSDYNNELNDGGHFENTGYYTWNTFSNDPLFSKLGHKTKIDDFWRKEVSTSNWCYLNTVHSMLAMQYVCDNKKIPVIFFSWFLPFENFIPTKYNWLNDSMNLVKGCANQFFKDNKIKSLPDNHYGSDAHRQLVDGWLSRQIPKYVLK